MHSYCHPNSNVIYLAWALYAKLQVIPSRTNIDGYFELTKKQETLGILQQNLTCKVFPPDISLHLYIFSIVFLVFLEIFLVPKL